MIEFAVVVKGLDKARWVLAVDDNRLLIVHDDQSLHWHPMSDCTFVKALTPDMPRMVVPVQSRGNGLMLPQAAVKGPA